VTAIVIEPSGDFLATEVLRARGARQRARGLLTRPPLEPGQSLWIEDLRGGALIHTFGMRYPIDIAFCDKQWRVLYVIRGMRPMRFSRWVRRARHVLELPAGTLGPLVQPGRQLRVTER